MRKEESRRNAGQFEEVLHFSEKRRNSSVAGGTVQTHTYTFTSPHHMSGLESTLLITQTTSYFVSYHCNCRAFAKTSKRVCCITVGYPL